MAVAYIRKEGSYSLEIQFCMIKLQLPDLEMFILIKLKAEKIYP